MSTYVSEEHIASIFTVTALKMEAIYSSEKSVDFYPTTRLHIPEDGTLCIRRCANLNFESNNETVNIHTTNYEAPEMSAAP
jgi:hypothetical protein